MKRFNLYLIGVLEVEEREWSRKIFEEVMVEMFYI